MEQHVSIAVINQGASIPEDKLPRLFERFFRVDAARSGADLHHGLGLSIVAGIAQMHGGQTFAESAHEITRIGITLPLSAATKLTQPSNNEVQRNSASVAALSVYDRAS